MYDFFCCHPREIYHCINSGSDNTCNILICYIIYFLQLLAKEQEADEKSHHLKAAISEVENLKAEVSRLRRYEDELNNVQVSRDWLKIFTC